MQEFAPFESNPVIAVAVSGGSDSMALTLLAKEWASVHGGRVVGLTIDHRLRKGSSGEAQQVADWARNLDIEHHIITWEHENEPKANIAALARDARYQLLADFCKQKNILHLLLAHQQDDVAEHFLMRALRGSGIAGLAAFPAARSFQGVRLLRPLLSLSKISLQQELINVGQLWVEDPSNHNVNFRRPQVRGGLQLMAEACQEPYANVAKRLADSATHVARGYAALKQQAAAALARDAYFHPAGYIQLTNDILNKLPDEVALLALRYCLQQVSGRHEAPRFSSLEPLLAACRRQAASTLFGCLLTPYRNKLLIHREPRAYPLARLYQPQDRAQMSSATLVLLSTIPQPCWQSLQVFAAQDNLRIGLEWQLSDRLTA